MIKKMMLLTAAAATMLASCSQKKDAQQAGVVENDSIATVYLTREITPEALVSIYKALGVEATGRVAVKMSTGEGSNPNYLKPELIKDLIAEVDGTIVECNTAYSSGPGNEQDTSAPRRRTTGRSSSAMVSPPRSRWTSWTRRAT